MRRFGLLLSVVSVLIGSDAYAQESGESRSFGDVQCAGTYRHHLQGICTDDADAIFWSFTTTLVKTDRDGKPLVTIPVDNHHGDLCFHEGRVYVAVNLGKFNDPEGNADSWVYVYNADDLSEVARHETPEVFHGAGGMAYKGGHFFVVGGLPADVAENYVYEYDADFAFVKKHAVASGQTRLGIQTATFAGEHFWFGCYGSPKIMLKVDSNLETVARYEFDCSLGIERLAGDRFLIARGSCNKQTGCTGQAVVGRADADKGFVIGDHGR